MQRGRVEARSAEEAGGGAVGGAPHLLGDYDVFISMEIIMMRKALPSLTLHLTVQRLRCVAHKLRIS